MSRCDCYTAGQIMGFVAVPAESLADGLQAIAGRFADSARVYDYLSQRLCSALGVECLALLSPDQERAALRALESTALLATVGAWGH